MKEKLVAEVSSIENEALTEFILNLILSSKRKWGIK